MIKHITKGTVGGTGLVLAYILQVSVVARKTDIIGKESIGGKGRKLANHRE